MSDHKFRRGNPVFTIDFDGTLAVHLWPKIGAEVPHAFAVLKLLQARGYGLILYTMRSGKELDEAVAWCAERGFVFDAVNTNPSQHTWTTSPKVYAVHYIGDDALGCPLRQLPGEVGRVVDWSRCLNWLVDEGFLTRRGEQVS